MMQPRTKELTICDGDHECVVTLLDAIGGKVDGERFGRNGTSCLVPSDGHRDVVVVHCCLSCARADLIVGAWYGLLVRGRANYHLLSVQEIAHSNIVGIIR